MDELTTNPYEETLRSAAEYAAKLGYQSCDNVKVSDDDYTYLISKNGREWQYLFQTSKKPDLGHQFTVGKNVYEGTHAEIMKELGYTDLIDKGINRLYNDILNFDTDAKQPENYSLDPMETKNQRTLSIEYILCLPGGIASMERPTPNPKYLDNPYLWFVKEPLAFYLPRQVDDPRVILNEGEGLDDFMFFVDKFVEIPSAESTTPRFHIREPILIITKITDITQEEFPYFAVPGEKDFPHNDWVKTLTETDLEDLDNAIERIYAEIKKKIDVIEMEAEPIEWWGRINTTWEIEAEYGDPESDPDLILKYIDIVR